MKKLILISCLFGIAIAAIPVAVAYAITGTFDLPPAADIGIWVVAGACALAQGGATCAISAAALSEELRG